MDRVAGLLTVLALGMGWYAYSKQRSTAASGSPNRIMPDALLAFEWVSPRHLDDATRAAVAFDLAYQETFQPAAADRPGEAVRALFSHRASALTALNQLRMRLPNDLEAERTLDAAIQGLDRDMLEHIEDARQRCGAPLLHPGPVGDAWYGRWYRAANDLVA